MRSARTHRIQTDLAFRTDDGGSLNDIRIRLLEAIEQHGSLTRGAKAVPMAYRTAWIAVDDMNRLADRPLVELSTGGQGGGGARLTPYGKRIVAFYRALEIEQQEAIDRVLQRVDNSEVADVRHFQSLLRRLSFKTSARNHLIGTVTGMQRRDIVCIITMDLGGGIELAVNVTQEAIEDLRLTLGSEAHALFKAHSVRVFPDGTAVGGPNTFRGTVTRIAEGSSRTEVRLRIAEGWDLVALPPRSAEQPLALEAGDTAVARVDPDNVVLTVFA
ncbi:MAG TPA: TOBE domain-containing protein [Rhodocyclaceae bacterium]|nr:TOBE domain-containing protein [Rhodocyclaceae bacterium]